MVEKIGRFVIVPRGDSYEVVTRSSPMGLKREALETALRNLNLVLGARRRVGSGEVEEDAYNMAVSHVGLVRGLF